MKNQSELNDRVQVSLTRLKKLGDIWHELGVTRKSVLSSANDVNEIYQYCINTIEQIDALLETDLSDKEKLQDIFVELDVYFFHLKEHIMHSRKNIAYLAEICDSDKHKS